MAIDMQGNSIFATNTTSVNIQRARFNRSCQHKTSFNAGDIIPIFYDEYLPGDTFSIDTSLLIRQPALRRPVMDNSYLDVYFFSVPNRLVWEHWEELMGENKESAWYQAPEYEVPQITSPVGGWRSGTVADYLGLPIGVEGLSVSALPFRAYALIWNEWFRNQNIFDPVLVNRDDATVQGSNGDVYQSDGQLGGAPLKARKFFDYFTSALPEPQKGPDVLVEGFPSSPLGEFPVTTSENTYFVENAPPLQWATPSGVLGDYVRPDNALLRLYRFEDSTLNFRFATVYDGSSGDPSIQPDLSMSIVPASLVVKNDNLPGFSFTVNDMRTAFQMQRLYEKDARGGTRYTEIIRSHFGVISPDGRLQRPEYLGGKRIPLSVSQVVQQSGTSGDEALGQVAGLSVTGDRSSSFTKSFTEHGMIIGLAVVRTENTYYQGLERHWSRRNRFDFYWPVLNNLGEQPIYNRELYAQGTEEDDEVFGYNEAWAEYRYKPSRLSGAMRPNATADVGTGLIGWTYAQELGSLPVLGPDFMTQPKEPVDNTLNVTSENAPQYFGDFYFKNICVRPMSMRSIPGLIDHY